MLQPSAKFRRQWKFDMFLNARQHRDVQLGMPLQYLDYTFDQYYRGRRPCGDADRAHARKPGRIYFRAIRY